MIIIKKLHNLIKKRQGFVLVDAMIAVLVLAIGLAALATVFTHGTGIMNKSTDAERAVHIASAQIDKVKAQDKKLTNTELAEYVTSINSTATDKTVKVDNITYTTELTLRDCLDSASTTGDQYIYPLDVQVTWTNPVTQKKEMIVLSTYMTIKNS
jgi:Tfp pilus assembly protein PilV